MQGVVGLGAVRSLGFAVLHQMAAPPGGQAGLIHAGLSRA
ncbi:hypothetical protein SCH4B_4098 [Ruegeria sp. TrichCH4B]|nr:hypothetical protein SCH4B_4098 [Ruegeria sp. TrichCH4B]